MWCTRSYTAWLCQAEEHLGVSFSSCAIFQEARHPYPSHLNKDSVTATPITHTHTYTHTHTNTHTRARAPTHAHTHTHMGGLLLCLCIYLSRHTHTYTHAHTHTHTHKHTHRSERTHTCMLSALHEEGHTCYLLKVPQRLLPSRRSYGRPDNMQPIYKQHSSPLPAARARSLRAYDNFFTVIWSCWSGWPRQQLRSPVVLKLVDLTAPVNHSGVDIWVSTSVCVPVACCPFLLEYRI